MKHLWYFSKQMYIFTGFNLIINMIGMIVASLLEGIGMIMLIPMLAASGLISFDSPNNRLLGILNILNSIPKTWALPISLTVFLVIVIVQALFQRSIVRKNMSLQVGFINRLRLDTYQSILQSNWSFFVQKRKSDLINALTSELSRVSAGTNTFLQLLTSIMFSIIQIGLAALISPSLTLFVICAGGIIINLSKKYVAQSKKVGFQTTDLSRKYLSGISDHFNGIKDIKSNSLERPRLAWLEHWCETITKEQRVIMGIRTNSQLVYKIASALFISIFILISVLVFKSNPATLLMIILIFSRLWPRFSGIQSSLEQIASSVPAFESIYTLQEECYKSKEFSFSDGSQPIQPINIQKNILCSNITFHYENQNETAALVNISINIPANQMTAVVGHSGAGKSTLIDLIMGLYQPTEGNIYIDGNKMTTDKMLSLRQSISYVPQDAFLFNASIRENLLLTNQKATDAEIWEALKFAAAESFIQKLPKGLETLIGDRGVKLSGGERQRIVMARALLKKPSILILDEATSALDTINEAAIQYALEQMKGKMTIIVVAHRLSTIQNADQIIVMEHGRVIEKGRYHELAGKTNGLFHQLLNKPGQTERKLAAATY
ncbi:ABC transporter ATP-binding protein [Falsibacillus albus]|uniref:ABC transporter ATP-binding protein n=1 Tax=Falsibacillus albus TaxID=2478915 RepID=A0A3L7JZS5_9BACI|nr:ABC transporter ATP-binding protein [Falsibacillus albus]RLQ96287.1 ABC transporter ATP-binding protein [Falsibacillus albus]